MALGKLKFEEEISKFHHPVVQKLAESSEETLKAIQDGLQNLSISDKSLPPTTSSAIQVELPESSLTWKVSPPSKTELDIGLNKTLLDQRKFQLPSLLVGKQDEIKETLERLETESKLLGTYKGRNNKKIEIRNNEIDDLRKMLDEVLSPHEKREIRNQIREKFLELQHLKQLAESYESHLTDFRIYRERLKSISVDVQRGDGLFSQLDKLTDKLLAGNTSKKIYNQIVSILDILLKEGSITNEQIKQYYEKFLQ